MMSFAHTPEPQTLALLLEDCDELLRVLQPLLRPDVNVDDAARMQVREVLDRQEQTTLVLPRGGLTNFIMALGVASDAALSDAATPQQRLLMHTAVRGLRLLLHDLEKGMQRQYSTLYQHLLDLRELGVRMEPGFSPADMWDVSFDWKAIHWPTRQTEPLGADGAKRCETALLQLMRGVDATNAARELMLMVARFRADSGSDEDLCFWSLCEALFEALAKGALEFDDVLKRTFPKLLAPIKSRLTGSFKAPANLARVLLYLCGCARRDLPVLQLIAQTYGLPPPDCLDYRKPLALPIALDQLDAAEVHNDFGDTRPGNTDEPPKQGDRTAGKALADWVAQTRKGDVAATAPKDSADSIWNLSSSQFAEEVSKRERQGKPLRPSGDTESMPLESRLALEAMTGVPREWVAAKRRAEVADGTDRPDLSAQTATPAAWQAANALTAGLDTSASTPASSTAVTVPDLELDDLEQSPSAAAAGAADGSANTPARTDADNWNEAPGDLEAVTVMPQEWQYLAQMEQTRAAKLARSDGSFDADAEPPVLDTQPPALDEDDAVHEAPLDLELDAPATPPLAVAQAVQARQDFPELDLSALAQPATTPVRREASHTRAIQSAFSWARGESASASTPLSSPLSAPAPASTSLSSPLITPSCEPSAAHVAVPTLLPLPILSDDPSLLLDEASVQPTPELILSADTAALVSPVLSNLELPAVGSDTSATDTLPPLLDSLVAAAPTAPTAPTAAPTPITASPDTALTDTPLEDDALDFVMTSPDELVSEELQSEDFKLLSEFKIIEGDVYAGREPDATTTVARTESPYPATDTEEDLGTLELPAVEDTWNPTLTPIPHDEPPPLDLAALAQQAVPPMPTGGLLGVGGQESEQVVLTPLPELPTDLLEEASQVSGIGIGIGIGAQGKLHDASETHERETMASLPVLAPSLPPLPAVTALSDTTLPGSTATPSPLESPLEPPLPGLFGMLPAVGDQSDLQSDIRSLFPPDEISPLSPPVPASTIETPALPELDLSAIAPEIAPELGSEPSQAAALELPVNGQSDWQALRAEIEQITDRPGLLRDPIHEDTSEATGPASTPPPSMSGLRRVGDLLLRVDDYEAFIRQADTWLERSQSLLTQGNTSTQQWLQHWQELEQRSRKVGYRSLTWVAEHARLKLSQPAVQATTLTRQVMSEVKRLLHQFAGGYLGELGSELQTLLRIEPVEQLAIAPLEADIAITPTPKVGNLAEANSAASQAFEPASQILSQLGAPAPLPGQQQGILVGVGDEKFVVVLSGDVHGAAVETPQQRQAGDILLSHLLSLPTADTDAPQFTLSLPAATGGVTRVVLGRFLEVGCYQIVGLGVPGQNMTGLLGAVNLPNESLPVFAYDLNALLAAQRPLAKR